MAEKGEMLTFFSPHDRRGGASGNKLKMTLGLPVFVSPLYPPGSRKTNVQG